MWIIAAVVSFVLSLLFNIWAIQHGHFGYVTLSIAGFIFMAVHFAVGEGGGGWRPWRRRDA